MPNLVRILRDKMRMMREDAMAVAHVVEQAFAGQDELSDDHLDAELRQVFYDLQDQEILEVRRYEYHDNGRPRRGYMWHVREPTSAFLPAHHQIAPQSVEEQVYRKLKDVAWERHKPIEEDPLLDAPLRPN